MLYAVQKSAFSAFSYQILNEQRQAIGQLILPDFPLAKNARLKGLIPAGLSTVTSFELLGEVYEITFEYLNRQWVNDIRFNLLHDGVTLATVDVVSANSRSSGHKPLINRKSIIMTRPFDAQLMKRNRFFGALYELIVNQQVVGKIVEAKFITVKRQVTIDLPNSISSPIQVFLFYLMQNRAYN